MKKRNYLFALSFSVLFAQAQTLTSVHQYTAETIEGNTIGLSQYFGKKIMFVNTASYCSYTPQFAKLEQLYQNYKQHNFEILGFPCNDFGSQDPHSDSVISDFCTTNYNVTFQMMSKIAIVAGDTSPIYKWLQRAGLNGVQTAGVDWNFNKFLVNESGQWVEHHSSPIDPLDTVITNWILSPSSINTGIDDTEGIKDILKIISPNPAGSFIELFIQPLSALPCSIKLYSMDGKWVRTILDEKMPVSGKIHHDISSLEEGVYILKADNGMAQKNLRIIVAR